jgi:hypothetical protein
MTIFYCLRFETPPTRGSRSPYLYPPGTGWPSYTPRHWVPFSSPPTTRRATVELFEPASTSVNCTHLQSQSYFATGGLPPITSSWCQPPWDPRPETFLFNWNLAVIVFMQHRLWREDGLVFYEHAWPFVKCSYHTYSMLLKILSFALYTSFLSVQTLQSRSCLSYVSYATTAA